MRGILNLVLLFFSLILLSCSSPRPQAPREVTEGEKLNQIISRYAERNKHLDPYWSTYFIVEEEL